MRNVNIVDILEYNLISPPTFGFGKPFMEMGYRSLLSLFIVSIFCCNCLVQAQQHYVGKATTNCRNLDSSSTVLGYSCNGRKRSCQGYLIFRSQPSYDTVASISSLLSSNSSQLAQINSVLENATFEINKLVIVPVNCSCSGHYYQANSSYSVVHGDTVFLIANNNFQGLSTCQAIHNQNPKSKQNLFPGGKIMVPLRCACPTKNQTAAGINYLLSYTVVFGDSVSSISERFAADTWETLEANGLSEQDSTIYPFTTLLVPLQDPPSSSQTVAPPPPPASPNPTPPSSPPTKSSNKTWVYIVSGVVAGSALLLVCGVIIFCALTIRSKKKSDSVIILDSVEACEKKVKKLEDESQDLLSSIEGIAQSLKVYKFEELQSATDNFSTSFWIKGSVYRGIINGDYAAIKKVNGDVSKEINLLNKINHFNLIRLSGVSYNDGHWYLVYEFVVNGPLSDWIYYNNGNGKYLNWTQRIQIALDVATGLNYLHSFTNPPYIHKDIKSSNVLLDGELRAKIANFTLARSAAGEEGEFALTRHIVGTKGYMSPEYLENGLISTKLDVYAFGVLMLEIITGKEAAALCGEGYMDSSNILSRVLDEENTKENVRHLVDPAMQENYPSELAISVVRLITDCLKKDPTARLAMDEIVQCLLRILASSLSWETSRKQSVGGSY
ncbi:hypothetical protein SLE2022_302940 [Rubroshorea leprosula]